LEKSLERLRKILRDLESVLVAFSGGVDSSFLLYVASQVLGERATAITFASPFVARREREHAVLFCTEHGIKHVVLDIDPLEFEQISTNPPDRCYYCKKHLYAKGLIQAHKLGIPHLIDGTQVSDASDHRPGRKALLELGIRSPLVEAGLNKEQIRRFSKEFGLSSWNLPPMACLASRIPYGTPLQANDLARVEAAEDFLFEEGFSLVRVRDHNRTARIELGIEDLARLGEMDLRQRLVSHFRSIGYVSVTLDLEGYRTGRMNELLEEDEIK
jgi:uncharacterized protein